MNLRSVAVRAKLSMLAIAIVTVGLATTAPASASTLDDFDVWTSDTNACGGAQFIDYGKGLPGGGNNDDYVRMSDNCADGHGVKAWAWIGSTLLGSAYLGTGSATAGVWDPFPSGNVKAGDLVGLKVCLVDGANDSTPFHCATGSHRSADG